MKTPLLQTKLYIPPPRPELVPRPRLIERLNEGVHHKLTLVSAPAGFGKTTLVSSWLSHFRFPISDFGLDSPPIKLIQNPQSKAQNQVAWLSLDEADNDPARFLTYLISALQTVAGNIGAGMLALLQSPQPPPTEAILTSLLNEIVPISNRIALVLDDYHVIDAQPIDDALTFLLNHLPPQMHLVITTRENPNLPLTRLRARGQLTELRAADLRFTPDEAATFLNQVMGLNLSTTDVAALESRTEGWIAGLQMAALALQGTPSSMQGRADTAGFIRAFTGSHRFVLDYLIEEVLQNQPKPVRNFLLQTAILNRLSGPLCNAVTNQEDGQAMLETLERGNLFVVPLDDERHWYRYHHLFADVLQAQLMKEQPNQLPALHQRASRWYEQNNLPSNAIRHALAAEDFERAAALVELAWPAILKGFQPATWLSWVKALPDALVRVRPVLNVGYAWTALDSGQLEIAEARLRHAEQWLNAPRPNMVVVNEAEFRVLPASIASARAYLAQALGDIPATIKNARRALNLFPEKDHYQRGIAAMFLGLAYWSGGELEAACQSIANSVASLHLAGHIYLQIVGTVILADIRMAQGRRQEAASTYEQALQLATEQAGPVLPGTADLYVGLSELARERNNLETATHHLLTGKKLSKQAVLPGSEYRWHVAMARIKEARGDLDGALDLLHQAERHYKQDPIPNVRPVAALKARVWLRQGQLIQARAWAREQGLSADNDLSYRREFEHITLARLFIARYQREQNERAIQKAMDLLEGLLPAAETGGRTGSMVEILVLQALAHQAQGHLAPALEALERALTLAKPEGYIRIFVDEGQPMQTLLAESLAHGADPVYVTQLLTAINQQMGDETTLPDPNQLLIEPLSERELEVLRLLAIGHTNQAVADELIIAVSTVKKHVNNIFGKLGVGSRTQAVTRARELNLL